MDKYFKLPPVTAETVELAAENLRRNGFGVRIFSDGESAVDYLRQQIIGTTVGIGGSLTVRQLGLDRVLAERNELYWHWREEDVQRCGSADEVRRRANDAEVYISSVNALSCSGELVNIDGSGNRLSALCYGPKRIYYAVGSNKLCPDTESAVWRARNIAAPLNAQRLQRRTPCAVRGDRCYDCRSEERICRGMLITARPMNGTSAEVLLINEELGM